jgi:hypothetical protein
MIRLGGDILVDYIGVGSENGQISLSSAGDILEAANADWAGDEVKVKAHGDIEVAAAIEAVDRIDLSAKDNLTLFPGSILSGLNGEKARKIDLRASGDMILDGTIKAENLTVH